MYQLKDRGLRVVTGRNEDEPLFESNGAGKSALVTAALWCLTGRATPAGEVSWRLAPGCWCGVQRSQHGCTGC